MAYGFTKQKHAVVNMLHGDRIHVETIKNGVNMNLMTVVKMHRFVLRMFP